MGSKERFVSGALLAEGALIFLGLCLALFATRHAVLGDSANSRLASAYALVHHGTWYIDRPAQEPRIPYERGTVDKVEINGRLLSSKPPILPLLMTAEYWVLHHAFGLYLGDEEEAYRIARVMTITLIVVPYVLSLVAFAWLLRRLLDSPWQRTLLLAALVLGTQYTALAGQLNNHVPGTAALVGAIALAFAIDRRDAPASPPALAAFGLLAACVFTIDMPLTVFPGLLALYLAFRFRGTAILWGTAGALPLLLLHFGLMLWTTGEIVPVQTREEIYRFEGSYWRHPAGLDGLNEPKLQYLFHFTFGRHGAFLLFPVLLLGVLGAVVALRRRGEPRRGWVLGGLAGFTVLTAYYLFQTNNYGGAAYGFRWYIGAMPVLLLMAAPLMRRCRTAWACAPVLLLLAVSVWSMVECLQQPWSSDQEWTARLLFGPSF